MNNLRYKMRSHRFTSGLLSLVIQLTAKESKAKENNEGIMLFFVLFLDKRYISQVIQFNLEAIAQWREISKQYRNLGS